MVEYKDEMSKLEKIVLWGSLFWTIFTAGYMIYKERKPIKEVVSYAKERVQNIFDGKVGIDELYKDMLQKQKDHEERLRRLEEK